jgi:tetratricopeptide (TPR) repeat protein
MERILPGKFAVGTLLAVGLLGCATAPKRDRAADAKLLFEQTVMEYHLPSAEAKEPERDKLLVQAAGGYTQLLHSYPEQSDWCAQALRSLANVRAEQGRLNDAVKLYQQVGDNYPGYDWEVLQAWKSAADLLWEAGRQDEARTFYQKIVARFERPDVPAVYRTVVRAAKAKLM